MRSEVVSQRDRVRLMAMAMVLAGGLFAGGCGGEQPRVVLPAKTNAAGKPSKPPVVSSKQAVTAAYLAGSEAYARASRGAPEHARPLLQEYNTGPYLDFLVRQIVLMQSRHMELWGAPVRDIRTVSVTGRRATLFDCQDGSSAGIADSRTHRLIPSTRGSKRRKIIAQLGLGDDGKWRMHDVQQYKQPC